MPEKTKKNEVVKKSGAAKSELSDEQPKTTEEGNWSRDQKEKSYYYDDAHGYEIYNPDEDGEDEAEEDNDEDEI